MQKIFFTSDLHFGHENVLRFDNRPFETVDEMDAELIKRWNNKVGKGDIVYVLGDMIWKSKNDDAEDIIKSLNGQVILIKGNHDRFIKNAKAKKALAGIKDYDDIVVTLSDGTKKRCILSHYFMPFYNAHHYKSILLHGHSHSTEEATIERKIANILNAQGFVNEIYNVGCMYWNYEPVTLDEIIEAGNKVKAVKMNKFYYILEEDKNGNKVIHIQGNIYYNGSVTFADSYKCTEWSFLYLQVAEAKYMLETDTFYEYLFSRVDYICDLSEAEATKNCQTYFNGQPGTKLNIEDITDETPCGNYYFDAFDSESQVEAND